MGGPGSGGSNPCSPGCQCGRHVKPKGSDSPNYVGDAITHKSMHGRVIQARGAAKTHRCLFHAEREVQVLAYDWAQLHETVGLDIADYVPLCRQCHLRYDGRAGNGGVRPGIETRAKMSASARRRVRDGAGRFVAPLIIVLSLLSVVSPPAAHAAVTAPSVTSHTLGDKVLNWAETQAGCWYSYGSTGGCSRGYDCSGLVYAAVQHLGFSIPRTTFGMLAGSAHLYRISLSQIRRGDLVFYGSGHVEVNTGWYHTTFGAQQTGTRVGWHHWSGYWAPTMAMRFR